MKKLILSTAIVLGGLTAATAQTEKNPTAMNEQKQTAVEAQVESNLDAAQDAAIIAEPVQDYKEVNTSEVPQAVKDAVAKDFNGATISKAYVNANGEYKIELTTAGKKAATAYANASGEWIKNETKKQ
ncbi:hypothetical protein [Aequorivita sp. Q41]|uniref:hypothetical protein n=1 Tax=Aequorivita sp. Q41 TaxID=3153300 RepID=UPI0032421435